MMVAFRNLCGASALLALVDLSVGVSHVQAAEVIDNRGVIYGEMTDASSICNFFGSDALVALATLKEIDTQKYQGHFDQLTKFVNTWMVEKSIAVGVGQPQVAFLDYGVVDELRKRYGDCTAQPDNKAERDAVQWALFNSQSWIPPGFARPSFTAPQLELDALLLMASIQDGRAAMESYLSELEPRVTSDLETANIGSTRDAENLSEEVTGRCSLKVGVSEYHADSCLITEEPVGTKLSWMGTGGRTQKVELVMERPGELQFLGYWNGLQVGLEADQELGLLSRDGSCWANENARVCYEVSTANVGGQESAPSDEETAADERPDLRSALNDLSASASLTCYHSAEEAHPPSARAMMRGTARSDYTGHLTRKHEFLLDPSGEVVVDGISVPTLFRDNALIAIQVYTTASTRNPSGASITEEQRAWEEAQDFLGTLGENLAKQSGLANRVYVLDFDNRRGIIATLQGQELYREAAHSVRIIATSQ